MSMIVAGNFTTKTEADGAIEALLSGGIGADRVCAFAINPPGQHGSYPIGGDEDESNGATDAGDGALKGAAIGGVIGLGAGIVAGPVGMAGGAAVGAYVGSFAGALNSMGDAAVATDTRGAAAARPAGVLVAVDAPVATQRAFAADVLRKRGARDVEETEGTWRDGEWADFNPVRDQPSVDIPNSQV